MRKIIAFLLLAFLMSGCATAGSIDIDSVINGVDSMPVLRSNTYSKYFSYYIPSDVSELAFDDLSVVMGYSGNQIVMNLNVMGIVASDDSELFDDGFFAKDHLIADRSGQYDDGRYYDLNVYDHEGHFIVYLKTSDVLFYGNCLEKEVPMMADRLLLMGKNVIVSKDAVQKDFKSEDVIDYHRRQIDLFEMVIAPDGRLEDLILNKPNTGEGE